MTRAPVRKGILIKTMDPSEVSHIEDAVDNENGT